MEQSRAEGRQYTERSPAQLAAIGTRVKYVPSRITVSAGPGDVVTARMPTPNERALLGLPEGVPVISVKRPGRDAEELFDGSRAVISYDLAVADRAYRVASS